MRKSNTLNKTITLLVPQNLDIDAIIKQNPYGFYNLGLNKEALLFICSELLQSRMRHRKEMLEKKTHFAPLCSAFLDQVVHNYNHYLSYLIKQGIIRTDNHFIKGEKCKGYCFNAPYNGQPSKRIEVESYTLRKAIRQRAVQLEKKRKKQKEAYRYLYQWWEIGKLKIHQEGAYEWIEQYRVQSIKEIEQDDNIIDKVDAIENANNTAVDFQTLVQSINDGTITPAFSETNNRFYNPISNLKRELRNFLTYNGEPLTDADFKNFQPFLVTSLLQPSFWKGKEHNAPGQIYLERIDKRMYKELKNKGCYKANHYFVRIF